MKLNRNEALILLRLIDNAIIDAEKKGLHFMNFGTKDLKETRNKLLLIDLENDKGDDEGMKQSITYEEYENLSENTKTKLRKMGYENTDLNIGQMIEIITLVSGHCFIPTQLVEGKVKSFKVCGGYKELCDLLLEGVEDLLHEGD